MARDTPRRGLPLLLVALMACAGLLGAGPTPAAAATLGARADTYVDTAAPATNFSRARLLTVDGAPVRRALLRFPASSSGVRRARLRLHAPRVARQRVAVRASSCAWDARTVTGRTRPRAGRALATKRRIAKGWNTFALPASAVRAGAPTCLQITTDGGRAVRFRAQGGARAPRLTVSPAATAPAGTAPARRSAPPAAPARRRPAPAAPAPTASWTPPLPSSDPGYCATTAAAWRGTGRTIAVGPGQSLQAAVNAASPGDTIELADGTYTRARVTLTKAVRLRARNPFGAVLVGNATPRTANDTTVGTPEGTAVSVRADGAMVEGLEIRYYGIAIAVADASNAVVQRNRIVSSYADGVELWDTRDTEVRCNEMLDPYLADDPVASLTSQSIGEAQMDYGVASYGSIAPRVHHNYFHGIFNQTLSFKDGNVDAYAGYNTFEGFNLTALFFGQNVPHNGPFEHNGLPVGPDRGTLIAEYNVFRYVYGVRGDTKVVYYARTPIRVWHVDATTILRGNVVESARQGIELECQTGAAAGCARGTILVRENAIGGRVRNLAGALTSVNTRAAVEVSTGLPARVTIEDNLFAMLPRPVLLSPDGVSGTPSVTETGNRVVSSTSAGLDLRKARVATHPDLSYAGSL